MWLIICFLVSSEYFFHWCLTFVIRVYYFQTLLSVENIILNKFLIQYFLFKGVLNYMKVSYDNKNVLKKHISLNFIFRVSGMALGYVSLPLILNYLGENHYGVWVTLYSIINWINNFDVGIGNGLKNRLVESLSSNNYREAKEYITTSYVLIILITFSLFLLGFSAVNFLNIKKLLNINFLSEGYIKKVIMVLLILTLSNFTIGLYKQLFYSIHKSSIVGFTIFLYQLSIIVFIFIFRIFIPNSLLLIATIYGMSNLMIGIIYSYLFFKKQPNLIPKIQYFNKDKINDIIGIGIEFFIIQLSMIVIFTTDNIIITKLIGPSAVTSYNIIMKIFKVFIYGFGILFIPFWPLYTEAYSKKNKKWIVSTLKKFHGLFFLTSIIIFILIFNIDSLVFFWLGRDLEYPTNLVLYIGIFSLIKIYSDIYMCFLNGISRIRLQLVLYLFGASINIPLSVFLVNSYNMGSSGVILATIISMSLFVLVLPIQTYKILNRMKTSN